MNLVRADEISEQKLMDFLKSVNSLKQNNFIKHGYVIEKDHTIIGCFILKQREDESLWLKQLYISQNTARSLPLLFEMILRLAQQKKARGLYLFSHQPMIDIILEALQFHQTAERFSSKNPGQASKGKWWYYKLS